MPPISLPHIPRRILFVLLGAIGDVTRALPLLTRVRRAYPSAHIAWAVEPAAAPLLDYHPALNNVLLYQRGRGAQEFLPFLRRVRQQRFDLVLDLQRHLKSGFISFWSGALIRLGFHRRNTKEGNWLFNTHTLDAIPDFSLKLGQYLKFADALGLPGDGVSFDLRLRPEEEQHIETLLAETQRPFAAFFLGSRWPSRFWFPQATVEVAQALQQEYGMAVVLVGGQSEVAFAQEVCVAARGGAHQSQWQNDLAGSRGYFFTGAFGDGAGLRADAHCRRDRHPRDFTVGCDQPSPFSPVGF